MDERKNCGKQRVSKDEIEIQQDACLDNNDANCEELRQIMQTSARSILSCMDELIQSSKPRSSKRKTFT
jgi:hypothetical protein